MRVLGFVFALGACAAPPMGIGPGATIPVGTGFTAGGSTGVGVADTEDGTRQMFQVDGTFTFIPRRWFAIGLGAVYSQLSQTRENRSDLFVAGAFPYLRPRITIGRVSVATTLSGMGVGAGGGGVYGGIADVQVGAGTERWSGYAGAYVQVFELLGAHRTYANQLRLGGEYLFPVGAVKLGVAVEAYRQRDSIYKDSVSNGSGERRRSETHSELYGVGLKLRIESGVFQ